MQRRRKHRPQDAGGFRYLHYMGDRVDSDLSITGWHLKFLRSAKNAGFEVPTQAIDDAVAYVKRCFIPHQGAFNYATRGYRNHLSRACAGAGILALAHAGEHDTPEALRTGDWILKHPFHQYNTSTLSPKDRYHYAVFHCCQGMYQLGGRYWAEFVPPTVKTLLSHQKADGSWSAEFHEEETQYGRTYPTALCVLALNAPNQILPICQR